MEDILLVHRKTNLNSAALMNPQGAVWKTCLRQISFLQTSDFHVCDLDAEDAVLESGEALSFLIEILCGLHSPVLGETEVLGQFRNFIHDQRQQGNALFAENQKWLQFLLGEVKNLRAEHIHALGSNSYGSLIRRYLRSYSHVTLLGGGHLTGEILPWMATKPQVQVVSRQPQKLQEWTQKWPHLQLHTYQSFTSLGEALIIAAPLQDSEIMALLQQQNPQWVFDLRGEDNRLDQALQNFSCRLVRLQDLFAELEGTRQENALKISNIKTLITDKVTRFMERSEHRPLGWDDLCA